MKKHDKNSRKESKGREGKQSGRIEVARKLLEMNMDIEDIINATELSKEEIEKIKK